METNLTRAEAWKLLNEYNKSEALIRHALTVEGVMRHFARIYQPDAEEKWGIIGLLHDIDFEMYPEEHCQKARKILSREGWPEEYIRAVESHGWGICSEVEPQTDLEKVLFTIDELTGLIAATALMRPSKSILDTGLSSVKKKWKQKSFAAGVNREVIEQGAAKLGMDMDRVMEETIAGMQKVADAIGLAGNPPQVK
ncbi:MAG: hydrolase [Dehalococcoidales bacterium]|nr:hydrolase [Dehalococcoidales bacterium]